MNDVEWPSTATNGGREDAVGWDEAARILGWKVETLRKRTAAEEAELQRLYRETERNIASDKTFRSSHWEEPNVLVHLRFDDRTDADGAKVLFLEELQSDWNQEGRKKGFAEIPKDAPVTVFQPDPANNPNAWQMRDENGNAVGPRFWGDDQAQAEDTARESAYSKQKGLPKGPFVTDTKATVALGFKRAIMWAVQNGHEKIAWANSRTRFAAT